MSVEIAKASRQEVQGPPPGLIASNVAHQVVEGSSRSLTASKATHQVVEGTPRTLVASKARMLVVEGPAPAAPPILKTPRRRQMCVS